MNKTAFIGHSRINANTLTERLTTAILNEIRNGCTLFSMGTHGDFDNLALNVCRELRFSYPNIEIEVVITSLNKIRKNCADDYNTPYSDVKSVMYEIEDTHYKRQITLSNKKMIDSCDALICYVDEKVYRSGAKSAMNYAKRKGLRIINLYLEQDTPFYGLTQTEIEKQLNQLFEKVIEKNQPK